MKNFFTESVRELRHVVWPTHKETQKYFGLVIAILVAFGLYLFVFNTIFSEAVFFLKDTFNPSESNYNSVTSEELESLFMSDEASLEINTDALPVEEAPATEETITEAIEESTEESTTLEALELETATGSNQ